MFKHVNIRVLRLAKCRNVYSILMQHLLLFFNYYENVEAPRWL